MKNIIQGFKNLKAFLPAVWRFRGWDYGYTEQLYLIALKMTYKALKADPYVQMSQKDARRLATVIAILEREEYPDFREQVDDKWDIPDEYRHYTIKDHRMIDARSYYLNEEQMKAYRKDATRELKASYAREKALRSIAYGIIDKYGKKWWS